MNKLKTGLGGKLRPKSPLPSPTNRKSASKTREKVERPSPKASRMQAPDPSKVSPLKRPKMSLAIEHPLHDHVFPINTHSCGYETPKFRFEMQAKSNPQQSAYNFFSFGEMKER